jgi:pimeloyl-ACP methyl ester carboxylesterase
VTTTHESDWTTIDWEAHLEVATIDGRRMQYVDLGHGTPLVLVHGLGGSWESWLPTMADLCVDHRVIAVDLPGFGGSDELPAPAEMAAHANALKGLIHHLALSRFVLIAHSMGGLVVLNLTLEHPTQVIGLVLVGSGGVALGARRKAVMLKILTQFKRLMSNEAVLRAIVRRPRLRRAAFVGGIGDPTVIDARLAQMILASFAAPGFEGAVAAGLMDESHLRVAEVTVPTLLIWGDRDRLVPVAFGRAMAAEMAEARIEVLPRVGHCPMIERPTRFSALVRDAVSDWRKGRIDPA